MKSIQKKQYTVRNLPPRLDQKLRQRGRELGKSLNEVVVEALCRSIGLEGEPILHHDLDSLIGTWQEDPQFDQALQSQNQIDVKMWS